MPILLPLLTAFLCLPAVATAAFDPAVLESVARSYGEVQPGLETYRVDIETDKVREMLEEMTASMPAGVPRPPVPVLRKYWSAKAGRALIRAEGEQVFPYMREMVARFSRRFAIDLRTVFLPPHAAEARRRLIEEATVRSFETQLEDSRTLSVEIVFAEAADLGEAFYSEGLDLPRENVTALALDLDPQRKLLKRLEITAVDTPKRVVELRHEEVAQGLFLPQEIRITTPDGRIDERLETVFREFDGYRLPRYQIRTLVRPGGREAVTVRFTGYRINIPLPSDVAAQLGSP